MHWLIQIEVVGDTKKKIVISMESLTMAGQHKWSRLKVHEAESVLKGGLLYSVLSCNDD